MFEGHIAGQRVAHQELELRSRHPAGHKARRRTPAQIVEPEVTQSGDGRKLLEHLLGGVCRARLVRQLPALAGHLLVRAEYIDLTELGADL